MITAVISLCFQSFLGFGYVRRIHSGTFVGNFFMQRLYKRLINVTFFTFSTLFYSYFNFLHHCFIMAAYTSPISATRYFKMFQRR